MNRLLTTFLLAAALSACRPALIPQAGVGVWGPISYTRAGKPGIDQGTMAMGLCYQGAVLEPAFAVWVGEGGGGHASGRTEVLAQTPLQRACIFSYTLAGVSVDCQTTNGKTGAIKIAGESFQLEQGAFFVVSTTAPKPVVKQMQFARLNLKPGTFPSIEDLRTLAESDADIRAFWQQPPSSK